MDDAMGLHTVTIALKYPHGILVSARFRSFLTPPAPINDNASSQHEPSPLNYPMGIVLSSPASYHLPFDEIRLRVLGYPVGYYHVLGP